MKAARHGHSGLGPFLPNFHSLPAQNKGEQQKEQQNENDGEQSVSDGLQGQGGFLRSGQQHSGGGGIVAKILERFLPHPFLVANDLNSVNHFHDILTARRVGDDHLESGSAHQTGLLPDAGPLTLLNIVGRGFDLRVGVLHVGVAASERLALRRRR